MNLIPQSFIDELLNRLDIVEIVDQRVKLKKTGKNYSACCPFHNEKTPSFTVSPDKQFYYCFGCGASGTAIGFVMEFDRIGFVDAVKNLARSQGMDVPQEQRSPQRLAIHQNLYSILENASTYYHEQLNQHPQGHRPKQYLAERGLSDAIVEQFKIGYAPPGWDNLLIKLGTSEKARDLLIESGLIIDNPETGKRYDRFRQRITFPIIDIRGRTIGFGGRVFETEKATGPYTKKEAAGPKYLNSPETPVFHKGRELYGLYQARQANRRLERLIVVEGYMDVIALAQFGIQCAVATLGTACGEDHLRLAFRFTNTVVFCFDGDNAGRNAAKRALENALPVMKDGVHVKFLFLQDGQDPDSLVRTIGPDRFQQQMNYAVPLEEFLFDVASEGIDTHTLEGRARLSKTVVPLINKLPTGVYRELMFDHLAKRTGLSRDVLLELTQPTEQEHAFSEQEPQQKKAEPTKPRAPEPQQPRLKPTPNKSKKTRITPARNAVAILLDTPEILQNINDLSLPDELDGNDVAQLRRLIQFVQERPHCKLAHIAGYWIGHYGAEAQKQLLELAATELLSSAKRQTEIDATSEFQDALTRLRTSTRKRSRSEELAQLRSIDYKEMSDSQKQRMRELLTLPAEEKQ